MKTEFYIAKRLSERRGGAKAGVMEHVATIATAVSLCVVIVTLSVVVGFKEELNTMISGAVSDIVITAPESRGTVSSIAIERGTAIENILDDERVERYSTYRAKEGVLKSDDNIVGVMLKGIDTLYNTDFFRKNLVAGELPRIGLEPRSKDMLISEGVARKMDAAVGDRLEMVFIDVDGTVLRDKFAISGIYRTGVDILDNTYVLTDQRNVARLYDGDNSVVTGYEVWLKEGVERSMMAKDMNNRLMELYLEEGIDAEAFAIDDIFIEVFSWLATHDINAVVVVVIMIIVALLNMTTALLIMVFERQRMIGELRAMGMTRRKVMFIFLFRALFIVCRGITWGAIVGFVLVLVQHYFAVIPLSATDYMLDAVPAALCWGWWAIAIAATIVITLVVMLLPAAYTSRISPSNMMRYE